MIPKRIFFFWGGGPMSWLRYMTLVSFKKLNPSWTIQLYRPTHEGNKKKTWNDRIQQDFSNYNSSDDYLYKLKELGIEIIPWILSPSNHPEDLTWNIKVGPSHKSNFFKWEQLSNQGGIYADMDILFIKPIDDFYNKIKNFNTGISYYKQYLSIGLLASQPNNNFFKSVFNHAFQTYTPLRYQCVGVECVYNFLLGYRSYIASTRQTNWNYIFKQNLFQLILNKFPEQKIYNISMDIVYPWKYNEMRYARDAWSKTVRKRDNNKCTWCNSTKTLVSHHIWHKAFCPESALDVDNGITLCHDCHMEQHRLDKL